MHGQEVQSLKDQKYKKLMDSMSELEQEIREKKNQLRKADERSKEDIEKEKRNEPKDENQDEINDGNGQEFMWKRSILRNERMVRSGIKDQNRRFESIWNEPTFIYWLISWLRYSRCLWA